MTGSIRLSVVNRVHTSWQILDSGKLDPQAIMDKDALLLAELKSDDPPLIHFYEWSVPCLTFGYFTDPADHLDLNALEACGVHLARRPTGGGILFHLTDFAFSVLVPASHPALSQNTLENYAWINRRVAAAVVALASLTEPLDLLRPSTCSKMEKPTFCMAKPTPYDLMIDGKKVGGAAQRRTKKGLLHQATLSLCPPPYELLDKVLKEPQVMAAMRENSDYLFPSEENLTCGRKKIRELLENIDN